MAASTEHVGDDYDIVEESDSNSNVEESDSGSDNESFAQEAESDDNAATVGNPAWADAINKILRVSNKTTLLSKAKKDSEVKLDKNEAKSALEIVQTSGSEDKKTDAESEKTKVEDQPKTTEKVLKKNREWETLCRKKPNIRDRDRERALARIATKGVVQMFNAVKSQQVTVETKLQEAGGEKKREKVIKSLNKGDFIDILKGNTDSINVDDEIKAKKSKRSEEDDSTTPTWDVFRDDFMLGAKMKDWDKQTDEIEENDIT